MARQITQADRGAATGTDELETLLFLRALEEHFGVDFLSFNAADMQRKLSRYVLASGAASISALQGHVLRDDALGGAVIRMLNRSSAAPLSDTFRLMALRCSVLPILRSSPWPAVWLADCADVRILVLLLALLKEENLFERTRVFMTSSSEHALEDMQRLTLSAADVEELQKLHLGSGGKADISSYLQDRGDDFVLDPTLRTAISWHVHHLATDASFGEFHAIVAARPLVEYGDALRERALTIFCDSVCPFGVLQLDDVDLGRPVVLGNYFMQVLPSYGVYRRIG